MAALPIPVLFQLRMKSSQRWEVILLLCLGFFVAAVGVVRTYFVYQTFVFDDLTWWSSPHWICSGAEICVALVFRYPSLCAC